MKSSDAARRPSPRRPASRRRSPARPSPRPPPPRRRRSGRWTSTGRAEPVPRRVWAPLPVALRLGLQPAGRRRDVPAAAADRVGRGPHAGAAGVRPPIAFHQRPEQGSASPKRLAGFRMTPQIRKACYSTSGSVKRLPRWPRALKVRAGWALALVRGSARGTNQTAFRRESPPKPDPRPWCERIPLLPRHQA